MNRRALISLLREVLEELGSPRAALEAFARAAFEARDLAPEPCWARSGRLHQAGPGALLARDDVLGAAYQALNAPALEAAYRATARERRRFTPEEIPSVTGLFTPPWVAELLLSGTLGTAVGERRGRVCDVRLLDPACGTMNVGLAAVEMFRAMYREEADHAGRPGWPAEPSVRHDAEIGQAILRHNLFGIDIDATALWLARLTLAMKLRIGPAAVTFNLAHADALFDPTPAGFDAVVTNPPYLSARNLPASAVARLKKRFPFAWRDLYACFIDRCLDLCRPGGRVGLLTMQSFMFTGAFERLRARIDERAAVETIVHLGPGLFEGGNPGTLQTVAFTLRREPRADARAAQNLTAYRLTDVPGSAAKEALFRSGGAPRFQLCQAGLAALPRRAWAYWVTPGHRRAFATMPRLRDVAPPRQGLATTDNARFVRYWWEVAPTSAGPPFATAAVAATAATPNRWFPYAKSGRFRRWYEAPRHRVNWQDDGREIKAEIVRRYPYLDGDWQWVAKNAGWYGKPGGLTYSYLTSGRFSARRLEPGSIFDVAGSSLFPPGDPMAMLAVLNSSAVAELLAVINPTVNFQVGDLAELPVPPGAHPVLADLARQAIELQQRLDTFDETSPDFERPEPWRERVSDDLRGGIDEVERCVNHHVAELYELHSPSPLYSGGRAGERGRAEGSRYFADDVPRRGFPAPQLSPRSTAEREQKVDLARRWASFALGRVLGRWGGATPRDPVVQLRPASPSLLRRLRDELTLHAGPAAAAEIERELGGLAAFLESDFYPWHVRLHARRPVYWCFGRGGTATLIAHDHADAPTVRHVLRKLGGSTPAGWARHVDDGIAVNLASLAEFVSDASLAGSLVKIRDERVAGRFGWSETARAFSRGSSGGSGPARRRRRVARLAGGPPAART